MIEFLGRRIVNNYLSRQSKERFFRIYNKINRKKCALLNTLPFYYKKRISEYPKYLAISLTTRCNLRCSICDRNNYKASDMNYENLEKLINPIKHAKMIDLTGWGEAILYPEYPDVLKYIFKNNNKKKLISQTLNGTLANKYSDLLKGRVQRLVISLNAAEEDTYNREMSGGDFHKTINNVKSLLSNLSEEDIKSTKLHFVVHVRNYKEMPAFVELAKSLKVSQVSFGQYMCNNMESEKNTLLNIKNEYNETLRSVDKVASKHKIEVFYRRFGEDLGLTINNCMYPYDWCFVQVNGDMTCCCYLADVVMGNVYNDTFESVWFGEKMQKLREIRHYPSCMLCAPFHSFDNPQTHYTAKYNLLKMSMDNGKL
ncbi:MAG: radical SAM protein [Candidatus Ancaeobacter aquaticus]|nr:radical SAM protein [Candidatus Ancaeobacter aquaticus]